jgi:hypothetical protein
MGSLRRPEAEKSGGPPGRVLHRVAGSIPARCSAVTDACASPPAISASRVSPAAIRAATVSSSSAGRCPPTVVSSVCTGAAPTPAAIRAAASA